MREIIIGPGSKERLLLKMESSIDSGTLSLLAKSDVFEDFFKAESAGVTEKFPAWGRFLYYPWKHSVLIPGLCFLSNAIPLSRQPGGDMANCMWLASRGIKDGVHITFPSSGFFTTCQSAKLFERLVESGMISFYEKYIKSFNGSISLTISRKV